MEEKTIVASLESHGIRPTANRIRIAQALARAGRPLTLSELETELETIDKSNIFRALNLFRDSHFVHSIEDGGEGTRYEICHRSHDEGDDDAHVHFHCEKCHKTFCLEDIPVPAVRLPEGYAPESVNYMVKGVCPACAAKA
jgi:Fur family ferric uptake transcriptional regulator